MILLPTSSTRFWVYLFPNTFSLLFSFFALYCLLADRALRRALHNHIIIVLLILGLIFELTYVPWTLYNDCNHSPLIKSEVFYRLWTFVRSPLYALQMELFAWATIERHILIFGDQWVATPRKRLFIHYLPIGAIISYYLIYYTIVYLIPTCKQSFDGFLAGGPFIPCAFDHTVLGLWDVCFHRVLPVLITISFSTALLLRSIWQKTRLNQRVNWRRYRKMIIQLLSFSILYFIFDVPNVSFIFAYQFGLSTAIAIPALTYTAFFSFYIIFLFPLVCCLSLPELREKLTRKFVGCRRAPQVVPQGPIAEVVQTNEPLKRNI